jgi:hypothetical protein
MTMRNAFRGPNHWNLDSGFYKSFRLTERVGLQFRGELFNLFNHPNLFVVGGTADPFTSGALPGTGACPAIATTVCPVIQAKKGGLPGVLSNLTKTREHRNVQLAVKLTF